MRQAMVEWSDDITISFISDLEKMPILWDIKHPQYKIVKKKVEAWIQLATIYNCTPDEIKRKWQSLQASWRREKTKESDKHISTWFAFSAMSFLSDRYIPKRPTDPYQESQPYRESEDIVKEEQDYYFDEDLRTSDSKQVLSENIAVSLVELNSNSENIFTVKPSNKRFKKQDDGIDEAFKLVRHTTDADDKNNECTLYGQYMAEKLKKLDDRTRAIAIHRMNGIIFEVEMAKYNSPYTPQPAVANEYPSISSTYSQHSTES